MLAYVGIVYRFVLLINLYLSLFLSIRIDTEGSTFFCKVVYILSKNSHKIQIIPSCRNICSFAVKFFMMVAILSCPALDFRKFLPFFVE